ncbi:MAG: hypothetical protein NWF09_03525 [Candidatus Bathyarchaeota archaeon]|nr:hypothetical protein [Candidatus Bathyarchaeota archaeon]
MSKLEVMLELLADGAWHEIVELQQRLGLDAYTVEEVMAFLCEYSFVQVDKERGLVRVNPDFKKLLFEMVP